MHTHTYVNIINLFYICAGKATKRSQQFAVNRFSVFQPKMHANGGIFTDSRLYFTRIFCNFFFSAQLCWFHSMTADICICMYHIFGKALCLFKRNAHALMRICGFADLRPNGTHAYGYRFLPVMLLLPPQHTFRNHVQLICARFLLVK